MTNLVQKNKPLFILFLITFSLRLFLVFTACGIASDGCLYLTLAGQIKSDDISQIANSILPPLFPLLITAFSYVFGSLEISARMISCIFGSLTVFPLFFLAQNIFNRKIAYITVLFFIIHPKLFPASGEVLTEALYYFLVTSIACISWIAIQKRNQYLFLLVGFLLSLIFLTRFEGIALTPLVLAWIFLKDFRNSFFQIKWKALSIFFCLFFFIISLLPYVLLVSRKAGKFQLCSRQQHYEKIFLESDIKDRPDIETFKKAKNILRSNIPVSLSRIPAHFTKAYYPVFFLPLIFGLIRRKKLKGFRIGEAYILSFILVRLLALMVFAGINSRYLYAFIPIALCWAGTGLDEIDFRLLSKFKENKRSFKNIPLSKYTIILLLVITAICLPKGIKPIRKHRAVQKNAGIWLKDFSEKKEFSLISPSPQEAFYANAKWHKLKGITYDDIISNAIKNGGDFLIADASIEKTCPNFKNSVKPEDLEVLTNEFENSNRKIVIYKLIKK